MRLGPAAALTAIALFALPGCSQPQTTAEATAQPATSTATTPTTAAPAPTPTAQSTPIPPVIPTPTLKPTETPLPSPTPTPATPTQLLSLTNLCSRTPTSGGSSLTVGLALQIQPCEPFAGRDTTFTMTGLAPWQEISVEFIDPQGQPVQWITEFETKLVAADDVPKSERSLYSDHAGRVEWIRIGTQDHEGRWMVRITIGEQSTSVSYPVSQLQLSSVGNKTIGADFQLYRGTVSNTYYTARVPGAVTVDLQEYLKQVTTTLPAISRLGSDQMPNIYLVADLDILKDVSESTGSKLGFADGFYHRSNDDSGIYMHTASPLTGIQRLLTHEYVHLVLSETIGNVELPAWLDEGTATYYEYLLGFAGERPNTTKHSSYKSADLAKNASQSGNLLTLRSLESQETWNSQTAKDHIDLQYAQSHMAVRYLASTYGNTAPIDIMKRMGTGATLQEAFVEILGLQYSTFEQRFSGWLQSWEDPKRKVVAEYARALIGLMEDRESIGGRRGQDLANAASAADRVITKRDLLSDAEELAERVKTLPAPPDLEPLHDEAMRFMDSFVVLLRLELEHQLDQRYIDVVAGTIRTVDTFSGRRIAARKSGAPAGQQIKLDQELTSEVAELVEQLTETTPPPRLEPLHAQGLAFLKTYLRLLDSEVEFLNAQLHDDEKKKYLQILFDIVDSVDDISAHRAEALQSDSPLAQNIATRQGLVSDTESLLQQLASIDAASGLEGLRSQGITYLNQYSHWLTLELEFFQSQDSTKLDQANAMITEINTGRKDLKSELVAKFEDHPDPRELNVLAAEISRANNLLVNDINAEYKSTPSFQQAKEILTEVIARSDKVSKGIRDLEFIYNLREP